MSNDIISQYQYPTTANPTAFATPSSSKNDHREFIRVFDVVTDQFLEWADDAMEEIEDSLANPSDDIRWEWQYISSQLAAHELFSTGGISVNKEGSDWDPIPSHQVVMDDFLAKYSHLWSIPDSVYEEDRTSFIEADARCILYQAKDRTWQGEMRALAEAKKAKSQIEEKAPTPFRLIDKAMMEIFAPLDSLDLDTKIRNLVKKAQIHVDLQATNYLIEKIASHPHIHLGKRDGRAFLKNIFKDVKKAERQQPNGKSKVPIVNEWSDHDMASWSQNVLSTTSDPLGNPVMYMYEGDVCDIKKGERRMLTEAQFASEMNGHTKWVRVKESGEERGEFAPPVVVKHNFNRSDKAYPELIEVKTSPFFVADGRRIDQPGYDDEAKTFLTNSADFPSVSDKPTPEEVFEAKRLLVEEVYGDFPFEGITDREERMQRGLFNAPGTLPMPSLAHAICMVSERAARDLIDGPTPVYTPTKPLPGTGAGRLTAAATLAATGRKAAAEPMPTSEEEYSKVMGAHISHSEEYVFFDNMNAALTLGPFASNVSEGRVRTRLLGSSRMIEANVRHTWIAAANNIKGTSEILRRMVMIELDAKTPNPEKRSGFRHIDLEKWVQDNRPKLVWAILTIIQNWVSKGMQPWEGRPKASFESWSYVMGGILRDAGIRGFLGNEDRLKSYGAIGGDTGLELLVQHLAEAHENGALFRAGGTAAIRGRRDVPVSSIKDELNSADDGKPLLLDGWGYSRDDSQYNHARGITANFRDAARRAYEVSLFEDGAPVPYDISFTEIPDPQSPKQFYWEMIKTRS